MKQIVSVFLSLLLFGLPAAAICAPGQAVFKRHCSPCHAPGIEHPGTLQMSVTRGESKAVLERRRDLSADYMRQVVRQGLKTMPAFKPTTLTNEELEELTDYLKK